MFELGNNLREARQGRRIDLVIAEQDTKIRSKYLAALEAEDFEILPGPVFVRGFLRTYSRYLGLDPQLFIDEYNARFGRFEDVEEHASPALGRPGLVQERVNRGRRAMRAFVIISLVALALIAYLGLRASDDQGDDAVAPRVVETTSSPTASDTGTSSTAIADAAESANPAGTGSARTNGTGSSKQRSSTEAAAKGRTADADRSAATAER